jgi:hypothetical protein
MQEQACGLSTAERFNLAKAAQVVKLELPFYWSRANAGHWHSYALGRPLKIRITWRHKSYLVQQTTNLAPYPQAGNATPFILDKYLHFETVVPTEATKAVYRSKMEAMGTHGWLQVRSFYNFVSDLFSPLPSCSRMCRRRSSRSQRPARP